MKITTLIENRASNTNPDLRSEWGLSFHIAFNAHSILFDTGTSGSFADNAEYLSVRVDSVDTMILSHHHSDHEGGLGRFFELNSKAAVYLAEAPNGYCYIKIFGFLKKYIGIDKTMMKQYPDRFVTVRKPTEILPDVFVFPHISGSHPKPVGNKQLYLIEDSKLVQDDFAHEVVMAIKENGRLVIFTGCSHNGLLNMVDTVTREIKGVPVKAVIGGFHLIASPPFNFMAGSRREIEDIGKLVLNYPIDMAYTGHCTGTKAFEVLRAVMGNQIKNIQTGSCFEI